MVENAPRPTGGSLRLEAQRAAQGMLNAGVASIAYGAGACLMPQSSPCWLMRP